MEGTMPAYYGDVDARYLQRTAELMRQLKQHSHELMHIQPGGKVLDVGCGPGTDTVALAHLVGPTGQVVGIDFNPTFVAQADDRAVQAGVKLWVTHQQADATALPFESHRFDACRSERLLQHVHHPEQAVAEMVRITRPGGWIVVVDADWGTLSIDTAEVDLERRLVRCEADAHTNGYAGRQLYRFLRRQQLTDIIIELVPLYFTDYPLAEQVIGPAALAQEALRRGVITAEEAHRWTASLAQADAEGVFFASMHGVPIAGCKPEHRGAGGDSET
jgi:ubiquinone/menaquinone biosynthesis C-methylase UbiE